MKTVIQLAPLAKLQTQIVKVVNRHFCSRTQVVYLFVLLIDIYLMVIVFYATQHAQVAPLVLIQLVQSVHYPYFWIKNPIMLINV